MGWVARLRRVFLDHPRSYARVTRLGTRRKMSLPLHEMSCIRGRGVYAATTFKIVLTPLEERNVSPTSGGTMWKFFVAGGKVLHVPADVALDDEHGRLNIIVDTLHQEIVQDAPLSEQRATIHTLKAYLRQNSLSEEALMDRCSFPFREQHKEDHLAHYNSIDSIEEQLVAFARKDALLAVTDLRLTLLTHILDKDKELVDWQRGYEENAS